MPQHLGLRSRQSIAGKRALSLREKAVEFAALAHDVAPLTHRPSMVPCASSVLASRYNWRALPIAKGSRTGSSPVSGLCAVLPDPSRNLPVETRQSGKAAVRRSPYGSARSGSAGRPIADAGSGARSRRDDPGQQTEQVGRAVPATLLSANRNAEPADEALLVRRPTTGPLLLSQRSRSCDRIGAQMQPR